MALSLNLTKSAQSLRLSLEKSGVVAPPQVDLAFVLDVSGSFDDEHTEGVTDALLARLVPWGMTFDPDRKLDVFTFSAGSGSAHRVGSVSADNYEGFVHQRIIGRVPGYGGGTDYSHVIELVLREFGWLAASGGFLSRWFGGGAGAAPKARQRSLVIFVTDGENSDPQRTAQVLEASQQRGDEVYFLFIGISNQGGDFPFLAQIAERFDNTGLTVIRDLRGFTRQGDEQLNAQLLQPELITWLKKAAA